MSIHDQDDDRDQDRATAEAGILDRSRLIQHPPDPRPPHHLLLTPRRSTISMADVDIPNSDVLRVAEEAGTWFANRARNRELQIRRSFVLGRPNKSEIPALARVMRGGGRGGDVRLKLLLSLLWLGAKEPYDTTLPARTWAELVGLPDPQVKGARRVRDALDWLVERKFVEIETQPGQPHVVYLLREEGTGAPYTVPGQAAARAKERGRGVTAHRYVRLPATIWSNAWLPVMSAAGIGALLILLVELGGRTDRVVWLSPAVALDTYYLSNQTRYKGLGELAALGIVSTERRAVGPSKYEATRFRNAYRLHLDRFDAPALEVLTESKLA